jgi:hypothetical protein
MHHALNGDVGRALGSNALLVVVIPMAIVGWVWWMRAAVGNQSAAQLDRRSSRLALGAAALLTVAFTVLRNTSIGAFLAP